VTVDAPQLGRREKDMRMKFEIDDPAAQAGAGGAKDRSQGAARAISVGALPDLLTKTKLPPQSFIDPGLSWADLKWMMSITKMPIILKGVQAWEDALLAYDAGCAGVVLSNHGGRQLEFARSGVEVLAEVVTELKARRGLKFPGGTGGTTNGGWNGRFEVYVDGGVRRASDALKAVAMGATAVGLGRPFIYAFSSYGQAGVEQALQILKVGERIVPMKLVVERVL
jgi:L-lactate dehydrogenase (cytochrome)